jgi:MscS family membrane protein
MCIHLEAKVQDTENVWDDALFRSIRKPAGWLIWVLGIAWAAEIIAKETESDLAAIIDPIRYVGVVAMLALFLTRLIREIELTFIDRGADVTTATAVGKLLRISVMITLGLTLLQTLGISISGLLAFGGIGGIAVGFAARDLLANFFGGLMIYLDRPFNVGDWIRSPDREIEGTVVNIGWRLTEIRTFDQRPLYVPNLVFANIALENPSRMLNRRIYETIGIRYDDVSKMREITNDVRELLRNHPDIAQDKTLIVNFNAFAPSSVDFFVYTFTKTTDWIEFHHIKEKVLLQIVDIIEGHGAEMAFPTSTVHLIGPESEAS